MPHTVLYRRFGLACFIVLLSLSSGCDSGSENADPAASGTIVVRSSAFEPGEAIPKKHERNGPDQDVSPPLTWSGVPAGTVELALVCDDPDAKSFVHWVAYGIPGDTTSLAEGASGGFVEGKNGFGEAGYSGPRPPKGDGPHHYHFEIYALGARLDAAPGLTKAELLDAMQGKVLAQGEVVGTYERK